MKSHRFETWFSLFFLPLLIAGTVIVMDNAKFHRKTVLQALAKEQGCRIVFLPAYSPDLNPIEKLWANLKKFLQQHSHKFNSIYDAIQNYFELG
jgi:transposase